MTRLMLAALVSTLIGCGGGAEPSGPCVPRVGQYKLTMIRQSGDCGEISDIVTPMDDTPPVTGLSGGCSGSWQFSGDYCDAGLDATCTGTPGVTVVKRGTIRWSADGSHGSGDVYMQLSGDATCHGIYTLIYDRF